MKQKWKKHKNKEHKNRELKIEPHRGTQTLDIKTPSVYIENCSEGELKIDRDNNGENFESTDEIDEENIEIEVGAEIQIIRPHAPIDGDKNERNDDIDEENKGEIEEIETVKELEETNIKEKQKIKELEAEQNTIEDGKLVHEKKDKELINSKMIAEKNEFINTILTTENSLTDKIETEGENPERDKKTIEEQDRIHKISKYLKNRKVEQNLENNIEIKAIEDEVVEIIQDLPNQPDPSADHSSYDDKTGLESVETADKSTYDNNESVETASDNDESR